MRRYRLLLLSLVAGTACSAETPPELLEPPPPGQGIQYQMVTSVAAGSEVEHCKFFTVPPEGLAVSRNVTRFTKGSHHVLMYLTSYKSVPTVNDHGQAVDTSQVFDCTSGATDGWSVVSMVGGSQNGNGDSPVEFPPGVAMRLAPGAVLLMNAHYINATPEPLVPEIRMNFYTVPESEVRIEGGVMFYYDIFIRVDPLGGGKSKMSCTLPEDVTLARAQSHMHRRGVGFDSQALFSDGSSLPLYHSDTWENVPTAIFTGGQRLAKGTRIEFACDYHNAEARTVWQGPKSTDEMCVFAAAYYPAKPYISFCASDPAADSATRFLAANWVGGGTATCAQTLGCLQAIDKSSFFHGLTGCVLAAAPAESARVSDVVRCLLTHSNDPLASCGAQISACANP